MNPKYSKYSHIGSKYGRKHRGICMYLYGRISYWCVPVRSGCWSAQLGLLKMKQLEEMSPGVCPSKIWIGYGRTARRFDHHPISKPEKAKVCNPCVENLFLEGSFLKPISTFYHVTWDAKWRPELKETVSPYLAKLSYLWFWVSLGVTNIVKHRIL